MKGILLPITILLGSGVFANDFSFSIDDQRISISNSSQEKKEIDKIIQTETVKKENKENKEKTSDFLKKEVVKIETPKKEIKYNSQVVGTIKKGDTCWDSAAKYHKVDPWLLYSIAYVESRFNPNAVGKNKNGTKDLGMMQINDKVWLPKLAKIGISKDMLKDPCVSVYVGAWILRQNIDEFGYTAKAIGAYNSRTPVHNKNYARKVYDAYAKFTKIHKLQEIQQ